MHPLATSPARPTDTDCDLLPLWTVEDLHDADLDLVLADRLAESAASLRAVAEAIAARL
ncbi:hypothetical protein [Blastococcus sp. TF02-09]|uniref:hypothetical protein n=1 Tax=Blastococcus sp. TF02-09 TaxID=2250576 RepID=UPI0013148531|nr:hypothetical protein [Blastococcus sp. TF02-9]